MFTPILVKKSIQGYDLIAGERRLRASKLAGLKDIPAIIVDFDDQEMMEIALLENIQREDLNVIEEAKAYEKLIQRLGYTQEQLAHRVGKSREHITNLLRLLKLPEDVQEYVVSKQLSMGHVRALLGLKTEASMRKVAKQAIDQGLMGSSSILSNYPTNFTGGTPILHDGDKGTAMMNLQEALNTSWNIPAFWTYQMLQRHDVDVEGYMTKMGYKIANYNIESLPLGGGIETTVAQQVNAYQMLSNGGVYEKGHMIDSITDRTGEVIYQHKSEGVQVFSRATASIMDNLLKEVVVKGATTQFHSELKNVNGAAASADWMGKTGTTDNFADAWLIVSTPGITLGGWAGYDNNTPTNSKTGYIYNSQYMARLTSAIYNANPGIFKTGDKFNIDSSAIKASVLKSTGLKPATVSVNGRNVSVSGEMVDTYWAKNGPGDTTYKFAIGGTDSDYQKAWSSILGGH